MEEQVVIFVDGGSRGNPGLSAIGVYVEKEPKTGKSLKIHGFIGKKTNNDAEYLALIQALYLAKREGWNNILVKSDSLLIVNQFNGIYQVKNINLMRYYEQINYYLPFIKQVKVVHIPREDNKEADKLVNIALDKAEKDGLGTEVAFI